MNKVEQFCGQCAVAIVAKEKRKKEGDHFNLFFLIGENKRKKSAYLYIIELKIDIYCTFNN